MTFAVNRQQANRLAILADSYGHVEVNYQLDGGQLVVSYGEVVTRALIWTTGKLEVTDERVRV
jgi:hypothetical protein